MGVTATGHVFHESNVASPKYLLGTITGCDFNFARKMNDHPAFRQRVEVHLSGTVKLPDLDLAEIGQCAQLGVILQFHFLDMTFTVASREYSIHSHSVPLIALDDF